MIPISPDQNELLNILRLYAPRQRRPGQKAQPVPLPSRAVLAKQLDTTAARVTARIAVLRKRGVIRIGGPRTAQVVRFIAKTFIPEEHVPPEDKPEEPTRESRRACLAFVTGHQPWQIELGSGG